MRAYSIAALRVAPKFGYCDVRPRTSARAPSDCCRDAVSPDLLASCKIPVGRCPEREFVGRYSPRGYSFEDGLFQPQLSSPEVESGTLACRNSHEFRYRDRANLNSHKFSYYRWMLNSGELNDRRWLDRHTGRCSLRVPRSRYCGSGRGRRGLAAGGVAGRGLRRRRRRSWR